jgi:pilus assembly protein FimV
VRTFAKTLAVMGAITPAGVNALGLGEIKLHSALNQKLLAEIPILVSAGEDASQIRVNLAPPEAFAKAGLEFPYYLSDLRFKPLQKADGSFVIKVTSKEVMREPFLDFLLEVAWPQGRMLREFTVLLDPPRLEQGEERALPSSEPASQGQVAKDTYGPVLKGESLWEIAERLKDPAVTTEQMALALFQANPDAFARANLNALKSGVILKVPAKEALAELSPVQARREFQKHYQAWLAEHAPEPASQLKAQLKLEAPQADLPQVPQDLTQELEALKQENQALKARLEAMEGQVAALLELKAELEALKAKGESAQEASAPASPVQQEELQASSVPEAEKTEVAAEPKTEAEPQAASAPEMAAESKAEIQETLPPSSEPNSPAPQPEEASAPSWFSQWFKEPFYLALGGGSCLLGILGWRIWRKRQAAETLADSLLVEMENEAKAKKTGLAAQEDSVVAETGERVESFLSEFTPSDFDVLEGEGSAIDPLAEADVYLAYGRYNQAEELIRQALAEDPKPELRLKLLEIFYAKEDTQAFATYAQELKDQGADQDLKFWGRVVEMGRELCPGSPLFKPSDEPQDTRMSLDFAAAQEESSEASGFGQSFAEALEFDLGDFDFKGHTKDLEALAETEREEAPEVALEPQGGSEDFALLTLDELETKLDLARAYVDMEDLEAAREILEEVYARGSEAQKQEAKCLLDKLSLAS